MGNGILNFIQCVANGNFGCHFGNGITGSLGSKRRRTAYTRVNFDYIITVGIRVERKLYVAGAAYAEFAYNVDRSLTKHLYFMVAQGLCRCGNNGVARMHANRVKVFHGANGNAVIVSVAQNFVFNFFPAGNTAFNQGLADKAVQKALAYNIVQFLVVVGNAAAGAAQSICRAYDKRITNFTRKFLSCVNGFNNRAFRNRLVDFFHRFLKQLAVFRTFNAFNLGTQKFNIIFAQNTLFIKVNGKIQTNLPAKGCQQSIRAFAFNNAFQKFHINRFNINTVGNMHVRHNSSRVAVYQYNLKPFFF